LLLPPITHSLPMGNVKRPHSEKEVEKVARDFEAAFLTILLKEMRQTLEPNTMFEGDKSDVYGGMFDQFLGEHLAQAGALGIARMVKHHLTATKDTHEHTNPQSPSGAKPRPARATLS
jgi:Rod binding domain-containing protein